MPVNAGKIVWASARTIVDATARPGTHVEAHIPPPRSIKERGGSPFVKLTITVPESTLFSQLSTTWTLSETGKASGAVNPVPNEVSTGNNCLGVQLAEAACAFTEPSWEGARISRRRSMDCVLPSVNVNLTDPRYVPPFRAEFVGVTVIVALCPAPMVPVLGVKSKKGLPEAVPVNPTADDVTLEMVNVCGLALLPKMLVNTPPVGETLGGAGAPAPTTVKTTAMVTGGCF